MLLEFSVGNYKSFHTIQTVSFKTTGLVSEDRSVDARNIVESGENRILKTVGLYGPNGSGKSNLLKALYLFRTLVRRSLESEGIVAQVVDPFRLSNALPAHAGFFQLIFLVDGTKYRYGFTLSHDNRILEEWLFGPAEKNETWYFTRKEQEIEVNAQWFKEGFDLPAKLRKDTLFLTYVSSYDGEISGNIRRYFGNKLTFDNTRLRLKLNTRILAGGFGTAMRRTNLLIEEGNKEVVLRLLQEAGLAYNNIKIDKQGAASPKESVILSKNIYSSNGKVAGSTDMLLELDESAGTQKFYSFIGYIYKKFQDGGIFICDEIDNNFHPFLLQKLIGMFNDPQLNIAGAQLLFTTHDTNLMSPAILRRDQIYFTEKSAMEESVLYALSDLKGVRNNVDFGRQYLSGFYGALPMLENYRNENHKI